MIRVTGNSPRKTYSLLARLILLAGSLTGCIATSSSQYLSSVKPELLEKHHGSDLAASFASICLSGDGSTSGKKARALAGEFSPVGDRELAKAGLQGMKKQVLEIPGGGGRYRDTQEFLAKESRFLLLEERHEHGKLSSAKCRMVSSEEEFLSVCAALGKTLGKAPDSNTRYTGSDGQFLKWNSALANRPALVGCEKAKDYPAKGFEGTVLTATVKMDTSTIKPRQSKKPDSVER